MTQKNNDQTPHEPQAKAGEAIKPIRKFPVFTDYLVFFGIFFLAQAVGMLVAFVFGFKYPDKELLESADEAVRTAAQFSLANFNATAYVVAMALTLAGFVYYRRRRKGPRIIARFSLKGLNPVLLLWGGVFVLATAVVIEPLLNALPDVPDAYGRGWWAFLMLVIMAPLFEEVIFRGVILESARAKQGVMAAWIVSSVVFGLAHVHPTVAVNAGLMGLILGFIYIESGSLWTPIVLHAVNNGIAFAVMSTGKQDETVAEMLNNPTLYVLVYVTALAVFAVSGYMTVRSMRRLKEREKNIEAA